MEAEGATTQAIRSGQMVIVRMDGGVTVEGKVDYTVSPAREGDEHVCVVSVPIPISQLLLRR